MDSKPIDKITESLALRWELYEPAEMTGRVEYLGP